MADHQSHTTTDHDRELLRRNEKSDREFAERLNELLRVELRALQMCQSILEQSDAGTVMRAMETAVTSHDEFIADLENFILGFGGEATALEEFGRTPGERRAH